MLLVAEIFSTYSMGSLHWNSNYAQRKIGDIVGNGMMSGNSIHSMTTFTGINSNNGGYIAKWPTLTSKYYVRTRLSATSSGFRVARFSPLHRKLNQIYKIMKQDLEANPDLQAQRIMESLQESET